MHGSSCHTTHAFKALCTAHALKALFPDRSLQEYMKRRPTVKHLYDGSLILGPAPYTLRPSVHTPRPDSSYALQPTPYTSHPTPVSHTPNCTPQPAPCPLPPCPHSLIPHPLSSHLVLEGCCVRGRARACMYACMCVHVSHARMCARERVGACICMMKPARLSPPRVLSASLPPPPSFRVSVSSL